LDLQRQSSWENCSVDSNGLTKGSSSLLGNQEYQSRSPDNMEAMSFQAESLANSQAKIKSRSLDGGKAENSESTTTELEGPISLPHQRLSEHTFVKV
jgi:hypothetical protein